jgi:group II intron reverse transcriptase/maturase
MKDKLYKLLYDRKLYQIAYDKLKSKPGNMTPGITPTTLDGISLEVIDKIIEEMKLGTFQFQPGRRVNIPKANGKTRPLTIAPPRDKLVQECIRMILESIYESSFSEYSHGFRPNKGCHSALKMMNQKFRVTSWFIEGDISNCFPSIDHDILIQILEERIKDKRLIDLIRKALKAGYFEFKELSISVVGTPQGSIISPILANIYLDKLDKFVETLKSEFDKGSKASVNPEWKRLENAMWRAKTIEDKRRIRKELIAIKSKLAIDPNFKRLSYVRYADD